MSQQLEINKLGFSYGGREILKDISFKVKHGGFVVIVGPNGSGKSTLLKNISASLTPQRGVVLIENENVFKIKPRVLAQKMAVVPQDTVVQFPFTVLEAVLMGRMPHLKRFQGEGDRDMAVARWAMQSTGTWHIKDRLIIDISGGERQRVLVARALAQEPGILLLDEPTANLDLQHQLGLLEHMQSLTRAKKLTVLAVLHDLNLAAQFSEHVFLLHQTEIFASGRPEEVLTPQNIRQVYGIDVIVTPNSLTGRLNIIPVAKSVINPSKTVNCRVHVICGGGTGTHILDKLVQSDYIVSCGVLNIGDSDWSKARSLGLTLVEELPFTEIRQETYLENQELIEKADVIVVMPIPFGPGNLGNLQQAQDALSSGKKVILVGEGDIRQRDFTGGKAAVIYEEMVRDKANCVPNSQDIFQLLAEFEKE